MTIETAGLTRASQRGQRAGGDVDGGAPIDHAGGGAWLEANARSRGGEYVLREGPPAGDVHARHQTAMRAVALGPLARLHTLVTVAQSARDQPNVGVQRREADGVEALTPVVAERDREHGRAEDHGGRCDRRRRLACLKADRQLEPLVQCHERAKIDLVRPPGCGG
jgi:hypothetical protein